MKFRMVDQILSWELKKRIRGVKTVSFEEYMLKASLGEEERLAETLILESFFQLANWLIILSSDFTQMGLVVRTGRICFTGSVLPGQRMTMDLSVRRYRDDGILFDGQGYVDLRQVAAGEKCLAAPAPLGHYYDPDDLRTLFSEIYRPKEGQDT